MEVAKPRKLAFRVQLDGASSLVVDFKALVRAAEGPATGGEAPGAPERAAEAAAEPRSARSQRFNIIERLEKRYGSGAVLHDVEEDARAPKRANRRDDDDLYDLDDPFIDDAELQQNIEEVHTLARVKTKHGGFFVNAGDEIETLARDDSDEEARVSKARRGKKVAGESSRAFLDEWSEAASDWQPGPEVEQGLEVLRSEVRELETTTPITKVFPRTLDDALRAVDKLVVESHPNKWRVNGYFATLMTFLPFTKQYLKSNMLRLEARDTARASKDRVEKAIESFEQAIGVYNIRSMTEPPEVVKNDLLQDKQLGADLHALMGAHDEWVAKENEYRQMLKTEDKKSMVEADYVQLNPRQERNRVFNRVLALFSPVIMDIQSLRALNKSAKVKVARKVPTKTTPKAVAPATSPAAKRKPAVSASNEVTGAAVKRATKPPKSRMMDNSPPFNLQDFEDFA